MALLVLSCLLFLLFFIIRKRDKDTRNEYLHWGTGVDCCLYYSPRFAVGDNGLTIVGYQEIIDGRSAIQYSVVKLNWWGKRTVYGQGNICGDYKNSESFRMAINLIPKGEDYRIEIFNGFIMSYGKFKIVA